MSLNALNTGQNVVITLGLLVGMLYCAKLVVDDHLSVRKQRQSSYFKNFYIKGF